MKDQFKIAFRFTVITTIIFGVLYPLAVTGISHLVFRKQANGSLITSNGFIAGSTLIGQPFGADKYFHSRPSNAGAGYDPLASGGSTLGPTNKQLIDRVHTDVAKLQQERPGEPIPADMVTSSGSGLDPDISPANAEFQIPRVAKARGISPDQLKSLVLAHREERQFGLFGEARMNVLQLNMDLDAKYPVSK